MIRDNGAIDFFLFVLSFVVCVGLLCANVSCCLLCYFVDFEKICKSKKTSI